MTVNKALAETVDDPIKQHEIDLENLQKEKDEKYRSMKMIGPRLLIRFLTPKETTEKYEVAKQIEDVHGVTKVLWTPTQDIKLNNQLNIAKVIKSCSFFNWGNGEWVDFTEIIKPGDLILFDMTAFTPIDTDRNYGMLPLDQVYAILGSEDALEVLKYTRPS